MKKVIIRLKKSENGVHPRKCAVFKGNEHLSSLLHYVIALREGADPVKLGLAKEGKVAYVHAVCGPRRTLHEWRNRSF